MVRDRKGNLLPVINDAIRSIHAAWSRRVDTTGELTRAELERLVWRTWDVDGEAFVRRLLRRADNRRESLPYQLQILESDWIPFYLTGEIDRAMLIHGVEKDQWGRPVRYWVDPWMQDSAWTQGRLVKPDKLTKITAEDIWHLKRTQRPNQTRGVTLFHSVIFRIADIAEFTQAHRLAARASADMYLAINRSADYDVNNPDSTAARALDLEHLTVIDELHVGESATFLDPAHPNQNAVDFVREELRAIAAACDVEFSQIANVYDRSFAAQRMEGVYIWRKVERDRSKFIEDFAREALYENVVTAARMANLLPVREMRRADPATLLDVRIEGPTMPVFDPVKERQAMELDQTHGWNSRQANIRRLGRQPHQVDAELAQDDFPAPLAAGGDEQTGDGD